jgi:two-component system cell cycle sensor histidine kinase/response regulator CckA
MRWLILVVVLLATMLVLLGGAAAGVDMAVIAAGIALAAVAGVALLSLSRTEHEAAAAQRQAEILAHAVDALPGGAAVIDGSGVLVHANAVFQAMVPLKGRRPAAALGDHVAGGAEALQRFKRLAAAAASGESAKEELQVKTAQGRTAWWEVSANPVPGLRGYSLWIVGDVTARRELAGMVAAEQAKVLDFLENAPVGFYSVDAQGRFEFVNRTLAQWLETAPEALVGGSARLHDFVVGPKPGAKPYDPFPAEGNEVALKSAKGRTFQALISQTAFGGDGAGALRTRSVVLDLTHERAMAEALRRSEQRFRALFENAPVVIASLDQEGRIVDCNPALRALIGRDREPMGRPLAELIDPRDRAQVEERIQALLTGGPAGPRAVGSPMELRLSGEGARHAVLYLSRFEAAPGEAGVMASFVDTTEKKKLEQQFAQSQKMQAVGQLAGGIAHDFNNLLTAMIGFCDLLLLRHRPGDQSFADIMQVKQNANRAANLVRQLLAFSRQQTMQPRVLDVTDALADLGNLLRRLLGESIELKMVHGRDLGLVKVDQGQLEQAIVNLAVNARDAMIGGERTGGTLTIRTMNQRVDARLRAALGVESMPLGDYTVIEVADTGVGIPPEIVDRIFEPFFSTKEAGQGTGLGLSTVYGIVKQSGGFIFVESRVGEGTAFRLYLPRHAGAAEAAQAADADKAPAGDLTGRGTVMLVEDEDPVRLFGARALRNKGYKVIEAKSGDAALELIDKQLGDAQSGGIDLLVTDVVMPRMDGPTLVVHARKRMPGLKVICISGYAEETLASRIRAAGDVHFLAKPFSLKQLAAKVKDVMRQGAQGAQRSGGASGSAAEKGSVAGAESGATAPSAAPPSAPAAAQAKQEPGAAAE